MSSKDREVFISLLNKKLRLMSFSSWLALSLAPPSSCNWSYPKNLQFSFLFWHSCRSLCSRAPRGCSFLSYNWICEPCLPLDKGFLVLLRKLVEKCGLLSLYFSLTSVLISPIDVFLSLASDVYFDFFFNCEWLVVINVVLIAWRKHCSMIFVRPWMRTLFLYPRNNA